MQFLSRLSKTIIIVFSITCSIVLFSQYGTSLFSLYATYSDVRDGLTFTYEKIETDQSTFNALLDKILKPVVITKVTDLLNIQTAYPPIWNTLRAQLNLNHYAQNPRVEAQIHQILSNKKSFELILNRSSPYIYYIYSQIKKQHLPAELALIPIIESEYNPYDKDAPAARGLWQLMPDTAQGLGVNMHSGYDGRLNLMSSTNAALRFFNDLGKQFNNNWDLAIAAYNCGPGRVSAAVKKADSHDYFQLQLPLETKLYVPRLLAIATIIKHADQYGIVLPNVQATPFFKKVTISNPETLSTYAKKTGIDLKILKDLNPDSISKKTTTFLIPVN